MRQHTTMVLGVLLVLSVATANASDDFVCVYRTVYCGKIKDQLRLAEEGFVVRPDHGKAVTPSPGVPLVLVFNHRDVDKYIQLTYLTPYDTLGTETVFIALCDRGANCSMENHGRFWLKVDCAALEQISEGSIVAFLDRLENTARPTQVSDAWRYPNPRSAAGPLIVLGDLALAAAPWFRPEFSPDFSASAAKTRFSASTLEVPVCEVGAKCFPGNLSRANSAPSAVYWTELLGTTLAPGFNLGPTRTFDASPFWNASALSRSLEGRLSVQGNFVDRFRTSVSTHVLPSLWIGGGFWFVQTTEDRLLVSPQGVPSEILFPTTNLLVSTSVVAAQDVTEELSVGGGIEVMHQELDRADRATGGIVEGGVEHRTVVDLDLSSTLDWARARFGLSLMNVLGARLLDDPITGEEQSTRAMGFGVGVQLGRVHVGSDIVWREAEGVDLVVGSSYRPRNWVLLNAGVGTESHAIQAVADFGFLQYGYSSTDLLGATHQLGLRLFGEGPGPATAYSDTPDK